MGLLDGLFGPKGSEDRLQAKMSLMGLTHRPNQQLMAQWSNDLANMRDERKATEKSNRTLEWMRTQAAQYPQLAPLLGAMETGGIDTGAAVNAAFQIIQEANKPADPWANAKVVGDSVIMPDGQGGFRPVYSEQPAADPQSAIAKLAADLRAGLITQEQYDLAVTNMAPPGMSIESDGQGGFRMVQGPGVSGGVRPFTEAQSKDNVYATRAKGALEILDPIAGALASRGEQIAENVPLGFGREFQTQAFQVAKQAGDEFLQAILRKDTGAAITAQEQALYGTTYLPQPGDGPAVLEAKKSARQRAIAAIEAGMSPAQIVATEQAIVEAAKRTGAPSQTMTDEDLLRKYGLQP